MHSLHIIAKAPTATSLADLLADGVYFARSEFPRVEPAASTPYFRQYECYYLAEDLAARGIEAPDDMQVVDTRGFVALSARLARSVSWY